ncbi:uncharacterized protein LOC119364648 [Triticum dicoccoides]|uniref:uncharacterized protein LOC119364648 n=1 Tax=Triticum dicoccoides TaxID=85692 RepID=UPI001890221A|nr:uncharacterized protein LOC119364648 [Triticum dicoccoides]
MSGCGLFLLQSTGRACPRSRPRPLLLSPSCLPPSDPYAARPAPLSSSPALWTCSCKRRPMRKTGLTMGSWVVLLRRGLLNLNPRLLSASPRPEGDICRAGDQCSGGRICRARFVDEERLVQVCSEATSGWTRRVRIRKAPAEHELNPTRKSVLELSMRVFITKRDGNVVNPAVGTSFD